MCKKVALYTTSKSGGGSKNVEEVSLHKRSKVKPLKFMISTLLLGACAGGGSEGGVAELGLPNVAGVFIVTVIGCIFAS
jgi:hypothetical protein